MIGLLTAWHAAETSAWTPQAGFLECAGLTALDSLTTKS